LKIVRKVFLYLLLALAIITVSLVVSAFLFQEQIIKRFLAEANEKLSTPVKISSIDVSVFRHFPQLSIVLTDVYVEDSHPGQYPLLTAKRVSFQLNPIAVYQGNYTIRGVEIVDSETNLKVNRDGVSNFSIVKEGDNPAEATIGFELKNVQLKNALVHYVDYPNNQDFHFASEKLLASIQRHNGTFAIEAKGDVTTKKIRIEKSTLFEDKTFIVQTRLHYTEAERLLAIEPSHLMLKNSAFTVKGSYQWKEVPSINLAIEGKETNLQTLLSLLPESTLKKFEKYESKGEAYFSATLLGTLSDQKKPSLSVAFGLRNATLLYPETKAQIKNVNVEGSFASASISDLHQAALVLKNMTGVLDNEPFEANLIIRDFIDVEVIFNFKGLLDAASVNGFYPMDQVSDIKGKLLTDISFEGKLAWLKNKATAQRAATSGTIELQNLSFLYGVNKIPVKNLGGLLQFNKNDMALSNVSVQLGNSDMVLNGFFKNIVTFLLFENQPIGIEADLASDFLDIDQLFAIAFGEDERTPNQYAFSISPNLLLNFNCDVRALRYKRFNAKKIKGDLLVKNEVAVSRGIALKTMGGDLALSGIVDAKNPKAIDVVTTAKLSGIHIDSVFYVFQDFNQSFIRHKHLKGRANAEVSFELTLNERLKLFPATLIADISAEVKNGELNNFEPLQKLNRYLDDEGLSKLRFANLKNDIHIENKTVYIPQMEIRSNVTTLQISGTHTFDQHIDYHVVTPLRSKGKISSVEAAEALEDRGGQLKLFLKITGTTDNYQVKYDTEAVKKKIASDLKKEVQELKDTFKNKGKQKKKELELSTEEFDWD
jgi:hypothetical protein